jgi:hypothetical protein
MTKNKLALRQPIEKLHSLKHLCLGLEDKRRCFTCEDALKTPNVGMPEQVVSINDFTADSKIYAEADLKRTLRSNTAAVVTPQTTIVQLTVILPHY